MAIQNEEYLTANPTAAIANPHATAAALFGHGGGLSAGERYQNELGDRRNQINTYGGLDPTLLALINGQFGYAEQNTPDQLLQRYGSVYDALNSDNAQARDAGSYVNQIFGGQDVVNNNAYKTFRSIFGRAPTSTELSQIIPIFGGAEGAQRGAAAVSQMFEAYKQSPEYLKGQAGQFSDELDPIFDQLLGRDARADEVDFYGQRLAGGTTEYEIRQLLEQLPEYQETRDKNFRSGLASELEGYDTSFFNKAKENVISRLSGSWGGAGTSSALDFALTDLMGQLAEKRGQYLAGVSEKQYSGNKQAARDDYGYQRDRYFGDQDYERRKRDADAMYYRNRADDDRDYQRQFEDMMRFQNQNRGGGALHTRDWIGIGLQGAGSAAQAYGASQYRNPYDYLNF